MKPNSLIEKLKQWIAGIGFRLFIWGNNTTEEDYWEQVYQQEKHWRLSNENPL